MQDEGYLSETQENNQETPDQADKILKEDPVGDSTIRRPPDTPKEKLLTGCNLYFSSTIQLQDPKARNEAAKRTYTQMENPLEGSSNHNLYFGSSTCNPRIQSQSCEPPPKRREASLNHAVPMFGCSGREDRHNTPDVYQQLGKKNGENSKTFVESSQGFSGDHDEEMETTECPRQDGNICQSGDSGMQSQQIRGTEDRMDVDRLRTVRIRNFYQYSAASSDDDVEIVEDESNGNGDGVSRMEVVTSKLIQLNAQGTDSDDSKMQVYCYTIDDSD